LRISLQPFALATERLAMLKKSALVGGAYSKQYKQQEASRLKQLKSNAWLEQVDLSAEDRAKEVRRQAKHRQK
jgi:hypothetical protein